MSTKIYNGFRIDTTNLHEVVRVVEMFRPFVIREGEKLMDSFFAKQDENTAWGLWIRCQQEVKAGKRMPCCDTEFSLTLFPPYQSQFYGIAYTQHDDWYNAFCEQSKVSEFGYWNNTDERPDGVTAAEFHTRGRVWNEILGERIPAMVGFSIDVSDPNGPMPKTIRSTSANLIKA